MKANLTKEGVLGPMTVGTVNVPDTTEIIVVLDTRGHTSDVYVWRPEHDDFKLRPSQWVGLDEIRKEKS